ncbi:MAG: zinc ribbon domain-containing protein [Gammaproteobacteria bacterium]
MPFYEYECQNCKFYTELLQKVSDPPLKKCPSCGKSTMKKLVSAPVFRLKGGGWYETDFKGDKENKRNLAVDKEPDTSSDSKPAKPAAGTEAKGDAKAADSKPAESKSSDSGSGGGSSGEGASSEGSRKSTSPSRTSSASKSRAKAPASRGPVKSKAASKAKPAARRRGR